jgi:hypothetical protein
VNILAERLSLIVATTTNDLIVATITATAGVLGALVGGLVTWKVAGPYWERAKLNAVQPLIEARLPMYEVLWELADYGPQGSPKQLSDDERQELVAKIRTWYYTNGAGLLLSDRARRQWSAVQEQLLATPSDAEAIRKAMSCLRTSLKQDIHVHDPNIDDRPCRHQPGWRKG